MLERIAGERRRFHRELRFHVAKQTPKSSVSTDRIATRRTQVEVTLGRQR